MNSEIVQFDLEDPCNRRVASEIVDLLLFYKTGEGRPRDIVTKMRFIIETYCTYSYPGFFDSDDTLLSIIEKIRNTGEQHPACALLDELDDIHNYSWDHCRDDAPNRDVAEPLNIKELTGYVRRTLNIVNALPKLQ
jgi:hypothetical protein